MLKKRWLNAVHMLSVCHPCLSGDVRRCQRWPGWRLFHIALRGGVLIESGHGLSSGGYACDVVPSDRTMAEHDTLYHLCSSLNLTRVNQSPSPFFMKNGNDGRLIWALKNCCNARL